MEIVIHGTKGGRKIFTSNKPLGLFDVTSDSPKTSAIGQSAYAIRFISNNTIFSKYKIIRDVRGDKRTGFVAFSIFLSNNEKLSGTDVVNFLDKVSEEYCQKYIIENNLNEVNEDWTFLELLSNEYKNKIGKVSIEESENIQSGDLDDAFMYFSNNSELHKYFDQPNQEEYIPYRQVYIINKEFKDKSENPLNALRNSGVDLTGIIDLENPSYKLREFHGNAKNGVSITIKNSKGRPLYNKDKIYRKEELTVIYTKKNHKEKRIIGSLLNSEEIRNHLKLSNDSKIDVLREIILEPEVKTFSFEVVKKDGSRVMDAVITCKNNFQSEKQVLNNQVTFSGEDLNERWIVSAKKGDNLFSNNYIIDFDKDFQNNISIILNERRILKIIAKENDLPNVSIPKFKVWIQGKGNYSENDIEFEEHELNKSYNITVEANDYERSEVQTYHPLNDGNKSLYFKLKEKKKSLVVDEKIKINDEIKGIKVDQERKPPPMPKFFIFSIVSVLILTIGIWGLKQTIFKPKPTEKLISSEQISNYLESDELILDTLILYKVNWEKQNSNEEIENWNKIDDSIDSAIRKRKLIDNKDFKKLNNLHFNNQESFEITIHDVVKKKKSELLKEKLKDVSSLSLSEIKSKIEKILNDEVSKIDGKDSPVKQGAKTPIKDREPQQNLGNVITGGAEKKEDKGSERTGENTSVKSGKNAHTDTDVNSVNSSSDISSDIKKYLKGDEIKYYKLEKYKSKIGDRKINESITIALKLWELDLTDTKDKKEYLNQIEMNSYLRGSKLNQFVKNSIKKDLKKWNRNKSLKEISNENN